MDCFSCDDIKFRQGFSCVISGPSKSGKTEWVKKLILNKDVMISHPPDRIIWVYTEWQPAYKDLSAQGVVFVEGLPDLNEIKGAQMLILDDMMQQMKQDKRLVQLFSRGCHHWNMSVIHIVQNLFFSGLRTSRVNAEYLVLMKNPNDQLQVQTLARQLFPNKQKFFIDSYNDATEKPHSYLLVDLTQYTNDKLRLRTNIFPDDKYQIVYIPKV